MMTAKWWFFRFHHSQLFISTHSTLTCLPTLVWTHGFLFYSLDGNLSTSFLTLMLKFSSVQSLSHVQVFAMPWTAACQASLSITNSQSLLKLMPIKSVIPSNHFILCHPLLLPTSIFLSMRVFSKSQLFTWGGQSTGVSALASFLQKNTQDWSPL